MYETDDVEWDKIINGLCEDEAVRKEIQHHMAVALAFAANSNPPYFHGKGDNNLSIWPNALDSGRLPDETIEREPKMPQPVCNYRKPRVEWYGTATKAYSLGTGYQPFHFEVLGDTVETFKGKRFIAVSEYETDKMDSDFLMKLTGGTMTTRTLNKGEPWKPQGEIIFMGGSKPPRINEKDKDTLDKVQRIVFHPAEPASARESDN